MKKIVFIFLCFLLGSVFGQKTYPPEIQKIIDSKVLRVAMCTKTPFPFLGENSTGFDQALAKDIANALGVTLEITYNNISHNDTLNLLLDHSVDLVVTEMSGTIERALKFGVSNPYVTFTQGLIVNRFHLAKLQSTKGILSTLDDEKIKIGYLNNSSYVIFTKNLFPKSEKIGYDTLDEIITATYKGEITAGMVDELIIKTFSLRFPSYILSIQSIEIKDLKDPICIFSNWENIHLLAWVNIFLERKNYPIDLDNVIKKYWNLDEKKK